MKSAHKKITMRTLAQELGLSATTVSRALQNHRAIHSSTRERVIAAATESGYYRPARARVPKSENLRVLLLLPPHTSEPSNFVFQYLLRGITAAANMSGCLLMVEEISEGQYGKLHRRPSLPQAVRNEQADTVLLIGNHHHGDVTALAQFLPVLSIHGSYPGVMLDRVTAFNAAGIAEIVDQLARRGHRRIAWMGERYPTTFYEERQAGFIQGCLRQGISTGPESFYSVAQMDLPLVKRLIESGMTALVCANDNVAFKAVELCCHSGLRIPEDLSLTGFDSIPQPLCNGRRLSGYDPNLVGIGQAAIQLAIQRAKEPNSCRMILSREGQFSEGESIRSL